jgi:WD40 repeat protein
MAVSHDAFISYSHRADSRLAPAIESGLEKLAKPILRLRALEVFRDETSLAANPELWGGIVSHLAGSKWFLLMASPESAASHWCNKEILWWLENRGLDRMLILLTGGEIVWDGSAGDFDWSTTTALSRALSGKLKDEPLYVDLRWARGQEKLTLADSKFRGVMLDLAAPIRGVPKDQLDGDDVRQLKKNKWLVHGLQGGVGIAAVVAVGFAVVAWLQRDEALRQRDMAEQAAMRAEVQRAEAVFAGAEAENQAAIAQAEQAEAERQRDEADRQRKLAEERERIAQSRRFAAESTMEFGNRVDRSLVLAALAFRAGPSYEATDRLLRANQAISENAVRFLQGHNATIRDIAFSEDGKHLVSTDVDGEVLLFDYRSGRTWRVPRGKERMYWPAFSPRGDRLALVSSSKIHVFDVVSRRLVAESPFLDSGIGPATWSRDGQLIVSASSQTIFRWQPGAPGSFERYFHSDYMQARAAAFDAAGQRILVASTNDVRGLTIWDAITKETLAVNPKHLQHGIFRARFSHDRSRLALQSRELTALLDTRTGKEIGKKEPGCMDFSPDGRFFFGFKEPYLAVYAAETGAHVGFSNLAGAGGRTQFACAMSQDNRHIAIGGEAGLLAIWELSRLTEIRADDLLGGLPPIGDPLRRPLAELGRESSRTGCAGDDFHMASAGRLVASVAAKQLSFCDNENGRSLGATPEHERVWTSAAVSPFGSYVAGIDYYGEVRLWKYGLHESQGERMASREERGLALAFSSDERRFAVGDGHGTVRVWNLGSRNPVKSWTPDADGIVLALAFSPRAERLAAVGRNQRVWIASLADSTAGELPLKALPEEVSEPGPVLKPKVAFTPDGEHLIAGGRGGLFAWRLRGTGADRSLFALNEPVRDFALARNGTHVAIAFKDGTVGVWPLKAGAVAERRFAAHPRMVNVVRFAMDDTVLISADENGEVLFWEWNSGRRVGSPIITGKRFIDAVEVTGDGKRLVTPGGIAGIRVWDLRPDAWVARACKLTQPGLSPAEWRAMFGATSPYPPSCRSTTPAQQGPSPS